MGVYANDESSSATCVGSCEWHIGKLKVYVTIDVTVPSGDESPEFPFANELTAYLTKKVQAEIHRIEMLRSMRELGAGLDETE
jgi:hypothetical protein